MANIILTSYCNLHCPYCFADTMIQTEKVKNISIEQFKKTLNGIVDDEEVGLIGGEPTLHPQFTEILSIIDEYSKTRPDKRFTLFTNGIYLDQFLQDIPKNMTLLINVNQPSAMTKEQNERMINNIKAMARYGGLNTDINNGKVTLGCNICQEITDYSFFFDILKMVGVAKARMSVVAPTNLEDKMNKMGYYEKMKPIFLDFTNKAGSAQITLDPDCNQIPKCFFTEEELKKLTTIVVDDPGEHFICTPVIDITPEFQASSCFGAYGLLDCKDFNNSEEFKRYVTYEVMYQKEKHNDSGKCKTCIKHKLRKCQGGCLAFSSFNTLKEE